MPSWPCTGATLPTTGTTSLSNCNTACSSDPEGLDMCGGTSTISVYVPKKQAQLSCSPSGAWPDSTTWDLECVPDCVNYSNEALYDMTTMVHVPILPYQALVSWAWLLRSAGLNTFCPSGKHACACLWEGELLSASSNSCLCMMPARSTHLARHHFACQVMCKPGYKTTLSPSYEIINCESGPGIWQWPAPTRTFNCQQRTDVAYLGCFMNSIDPASSVLPSLIVSQAGMTIEMCRDAARDAGHIYFGLQDGTDCFGGG